MQKKKRRRQLSPDAANEISVDAAVTAVFLFGFFLQSDVFSQKKKKKCCNKGFVL